MYGVARAIKNGSTYYGKALPKCKACQRQFVFGRTHERLSDECKRRVELILAGRISLDAICRVMEIKQHQLYAYIDELYDEAPDDLACPVTGDTDIELTNADCESDELWSFVGRKTNKQWLWLALDGRSRQVVALHVGNRGEEGAKGL